MEVWEQAIRVARGVWVPGGKEVQDEKKESRLEKCKDNKDGGGHFRLSQPPLKNQKKKGPFYK